MYKTVIYVLQPENGWDSVVAVYDGSLVTHEAVERDFPEECYIIQETRLLSKTDN